jgi:protein SDA1
MFIILTIDWKQWEVGSEEDESDDSGGWINVSSDEEHGIDISDSEDEETKPPPEKLELSASTLATSKVLTHWTFLIPRFLRLQIWQNWKSFGQKRSLTVLFENQKSQKSRHIGDATNHRRKMESMKDDGVVDVADILGPRKKAKQDREQRMAHAAEGREGREKFASKKATRREEGPHTSTTNREKARKKNLMMTIHKIRKGNQGGLVGHGKKFRAMERKRQKGKVKK